ncbi:hypothetical protein KAR91_19835, partial [Candidatus Pacearchaeota archaeon]|nr:hypothetical protein [Candidatus Pacearchaeota archaeon]
MKKLTPIAAAVLLAMGSSAWAADNYSSQFQSGVNNYANVNQVTNSTGNSAIQSQVGDNNTANSLQYYASENDITQEQDGD